jgi:hypothetical protein
MTVDRQLGGEPETEAGQVEPSPSHPSGDGAVIVCRACGQENAAGADQCGRQGCRKTLKGNALSRRNSLYAFNLAPEVRAIEDAGQALVEQSIVDAGGRTELIARELADHSYRGVLHIRILKLAHALDTQGEFDKRGRLRKGWIELLDQLISSAVTIDKTLGLQRRPKPVDDWSDIQREYANKRAADQPTPGAAENALAERELPAGGARDDAPSPVNSTAEGEERT